jgi:hypothetical protein
MILCLDVAMLVTRCTFVCRAIAPCTTAIYALIVVLAPCSRLQTRNTLQHVGIFKALH